jgi:hypothetical protein
MTPVSAQRANALEGFHTAAQNAALKDGFSAIHFKIKRLRREVSGGVPVLLPLRKLAGGSA